MFPRQLASWWEHGGGAARIRWGEHGDFDRCVALAVADAHMTPGRAKGFCAERHHAALGIWPATHAAMEKHAGRTAVASGQMDSDGDYDGDGLDGSWDGDQSDLPDMTGLGVPHMVAAEQAGGMTPPAARAVPAKAAGPVGTGARFKALSATLAAKGASDPNALAAWIGRRKYGRGPFKKLAAVARKSHGGASRSSYAEYMRLYPLEDMHILRSADGGDGRTVEAYATVFETAAEIHDFEGHYAEVIDRSAFNRAIDHVERQRGGLSNVKVLYNHGRRLDGSASDKYSMPIGVPVMIRAEQRGLLTRTRYSETPTAEEILENIRSGAITSQSFTGRIVRSDPGLGLGETYRPRAGQLQTVRRMELGLREYGPVLWPAYSGAEILGVRMSVPGEYVPGEDPGTPPDEGPAAGDPLRPIPDGGGDEHSARYHQHALYALRSRELREKKGLTW